MMLSMYIFNRVSSTFYPAEIVAFVMYPHLVALLLKYPIYEALNMIFVQLSNLLILLDRTNMLRVPDATKYVKIGHRHP
jgi:hypothetical protein